MKAQKSAFELWYATYPDRESDQLIENFLICKTRNNWIERVRSALFLSTNQVAKQAEITRQYLSKVEKNEYTGNIKISTLTKIAEAMDCELVYAIRPKSKRLFGEIIWEVLENAAAENYRGFISQKMEKRISWFARERVTDPKFQKNKIGPNANQKTIYSRQPFLDLVAPSSDK